MKTRFFFIASLLLFVSSVHAQKTYKALMNDNSVNFYDVCKEAEAYFETHDKNVKGSGWKGYQRWKHANEYKYYPSGDRSNVDPIFAANAFDNLLKSPGIQHPKQLSNGWKELGPYRIDSITGQYSAGLGRVEAVYVDPNNSDKMYFGSRSGGFWKTTDGGDTWEGGSTDFLPASGVNTIAVSPTNSDSILVNIRNANNGYSHGIYRSINGGSSWVLSNFQPANIGFGGLGDNFRIFKIAYHPIVPNLIFIGTSKGVYRSDDNLQTWTRLINSGDVTQITFHPTNPDIIYVYDDYYWSNFQNYIYRSVDGGLSYNVTNEITANNNSSAFLSVSEDCPNCLYFASTEGVWKSIDEGDNFTFLSNPPQTCLGFAVNDQDTSQMIYGYVDIEASDDGGKTFEQITFWSLGNGAHGAGNFNQNFNNSPSYVHADLHPAICVNGVYYIGTDGFFCKSADNGTSWEILNQGTAIRENYKLGASQSNHYTTISGSQDNGTSIKKKGEWIEFYGADGMEASFIR